MWHDMSQHWILLSSLHAWLQVYAIENNKPCDINNYPVDNIPDNIHKMPYYTTNHQPVCGFELPIGYLRQIYGISTVLQTFWRDKNAIFNNPLLKRWESTLDIIETVDFHLSKPLNNMIQFCFSHGLDEWKRFLKVQPLKIRARIH